jgi:hypothetical protein
MKRKAFIIGGRLLAGVFVIYALMTVASLAFVKSATNVVGDVFSPDGKWDVMLMVRNGGATTDFSTQLSIVPAGSRLARETAICRPGNVFVADGNNGAVSVDHRGLMPVNVVWESGTQLRITYPPNAHVFKREQHFQMLTINYAQ